MLRRLLSTLLLISITGFAAIAQSGQGQLKGKVIDESTGDPIPFANVVVKLNGVFQVGGTTDMDGVFLIKPISPGTYSVEASTIGMQTAIINGVGIRSDKTAFLDIKLKTKSEMLEEFVVTEYKVPLFEKDQTVISQTVTKEDLVNMAARSPSDIAATVGGVYSADDGSGGLNIRGARSDANYYFIDGIKVRGSSNLPQSGIEEISVITGGVPAQYGDITGGVIAITTKGPSANYFGSVEYVTSGYKIGDDVYGLDKYGYNLLEASVSGPLLMKKDTNGEKTNPLVGFFLSGNFQSYIDPRPTATGMWQIKDEALDQISANPLIRASDGESGTFQSADFLRLNSFEKVNTRSNVAENGFVVNGKLDFATGKNTNLTFGGMYDWKRYNEFQYTSSLLNYNNYPQVTENTWRVFGRFTQRFSNESTEDDKSSSVIKNAYYSVQVDYNQDNYVRQDENHGDDLFAYGYYGQFKRYQARDYEVEVDTVYGSEGQPIYYGEINNQITFQDTLIGFTPSSLNPEAAAYTNSYFELFGWEGYDENGNPIYDTEIASEDLNGDGQITDQERNYYLRSFTNIQSSGGLLNGDLAYTPNYIYSIWNNQAMVFNNYRTYSRSQFRVSATGSADIYDHAISLGFEYEQRVDRGYAANPVGLWRIGDLLTNNHINNLDPYSSTIDFSQTIPTVNYERLNSSPDPYSGDANPDETQAFVDYNIRNSLGLDPNGTDFIDFQNLTPEQLKIDYFSANELLNSGNELVYYYGYDPYGNRVNDNPSIDDFFTATDEYGNYTRPIGAFRPTYVAGYIQDKFTFEDLIFNVGVRVDRYDANQSVLIDPYVMFPTVRAGEAGAQSIISEMEGYSMPGNIGDDYVVYVDNIENPTSVVGYRDGKTWYNASGDEIANGSSLEGANGIAPLLVDNTDRDPSTDLTSASFEDYAPQINFMPRIAFSFPISEDATFFAHYDVLTKRPTVGSSLYNYSRLNILDYYFINQRSATDIIANPNLKPERTIDYSLGFKQKISNQSSISIEAFYREMRDQIQIVGVTQAYPQAYTSYDNVDFGTVKGLTFSYDLRRGTSPFSLRASYTLQFAEGTGSSTSSALNLIRAGLQNLRNTTALTYDQRHTFVATLDYRYGEKQGPKINDKPILENAGVNFQFNLGSGTPYSRQLSPTGTRLISGGNSPLLDGSINGSRLPWQYRIDMRLDKNFALNVGKKDKAMDLNIYLQVLNVLNSLNTINVYRATGEANDDGYLGEPTYQNTINSSTDPQTYTEMYTMSMQDYRYYTLPRRTRIGFILSF